MGKKKTRFDGVIVKRETDDLGYIYAYDKNDRLCWENNKPERVVLNDDLRRYAPGLHVGQLGWTIPGTTDGYKEVDVEFDNGERLLILTFGISRVVPEQAESIAAKIIEDHRNTRFDADPAVAERCWKEWNKIEHSQYVDTDSMLEMGVGPEDVYAFTFASLQRLAELEGRDRYPVKIGYTGTVPNGAIGRIRQIMGDATAYPERPVLLFVCHTSDGRQLETSIQGILRKDGRRIRTAVGKEWFETSSDEIVQIISEIH